MMKRNPDLHIAILDCWLITHQATTLLIKTLPERSWHQVVPGYTRKTIGSLAIHIHNARCSWIKQMSGKNIIKSLKMVSIQRGTRKQLLAALEQSNKAMLDLLNDCLNRGGSLPERPIWLNFPNDVVHLLGYFVAHEAHHRGQLIMAARQLNAALTKEEAGELWQWIKRSKEAHKLLNGPLRRK